MGAMSQASRLLDAVAGGDPHAATELLPLDVVGLAAEADPTQIMALDEAISRLEQEDGDAARASCACDFTRIGVSRKSPRRSARRHEQ